MGLTALHTDHRHPHVDAPIEDEDALEVDGLPGSFVLHYQPELDLATGAVTACEALLRWWHPQFGMLRPGASLHQTKWAVRLAGVEEWAITAACRQSAAWAREGRHLQVELNVSRRHLAEPGFVRDLEATIAATGAEPTNLGIDVPFSAFTKAPVATLAASRAMAASGITVVADGVTGTAGRAGLLDAPVSAVKVPLYAAPGRRGGLHPSVAAGLGLAHQIGAVGIAKAVETAADLDVLRLMGFERAFGHVFSPPLTAEGLSILLGR